MGVWHSNLQRCALPPLNPHPTPFPWEGEGNIISRLTFPVSGGGSKDQSPATAAAFRAAPRSQPSAAAIGRAERGRYAVVHSPPWQASSQIS